MIYRLWTWILTIVYFFRSSSLPNFARRNPSQSSRNSALVGQRDSTLLNESLPEGTERVSFTKFSVTSQFFVIRLPKFSVISQFFVISLPKFSVISQSLSSVLGGLSVVKYYSILYCE